MTFVPTMGYAVPTPDRVYIKILNEAARYPDGVHYSTIAKALFPGKGKGQNIDLFKSLIGNGCIRFSHCGEHDRKFYYKVTDKGLKLLEFSNQFADIVDFYEIAKSRTFAEFMMEIVFRAKARYSSKDFAARLSQLLSYKDSNSCAAEWITLKCEPKALHACQVHMRNMISKIKWLPEYFAYVSSK